MSEAQLRLESSIENSFTKKNSTINEHLKDTITDELVIGLCGPIGTDINYISKCLREILEDSFNYECVDIKLSEFIKKKLNTSPSARSFNYYDLLIKKGNELRQSHGNDILAKFSIHKITQDRQIRSTDDDDLVSLKGFVT